jgi:hypothetical protein
MNVLLNPNDDDDNLFVIKEDEQCYKFKRNSKGVHRLTLQYPFCSNTAQLAVEGFS